MLKDESILIHGIVTPSNWAEDGKILGIKLCSSGELDFLVCRDGLGIELEKYLQKLVSVKALVLKKEPVVEIKVLDIKLLNNKGEKHETF